MADFSRYKQADNADFDFTHLPDGTEVEIQVLGFVERDIQKTATIIQKCKIVRIVSLPDEEDRDTFEEIALGKTYDQFHKFGPVHAPGLRILRKIFKEAGFDEPSWKVGTETPGQQMIPCSLRYLAVKNANVIGIVRAGKPQDGKEVKNFFNWTAISRNDRDGVPYPDGLPEKVDNDTVIDAWELPIPGQAVEDSPY